MTSRLRWWLRPLTLTTVVAVVALVGLAILAPLVWGDKASVGDPSRISEGRSADHFFGTDAGGRDVLLRTLVATRLSVAMALLATVIGVTGGIVLGLLPRLAGPRLSRLFVSGINIAVAFPGLLLAIVLAVVLGRSPTSAVIAIGAAMAPDFARLTYTLSSSVWGRDYVEAARVLGVPRTTILARHVLPNIRDPLIVRATISAGICLVAFASLSFLGLGVQAPSYDWGRLLAEGQTRIFVNPASALVPGAAIVLAGLVFTLLGELLAKSLPGTQAVRVSRRHRGRKVLPESPAPTSTADGTVGDDEAVVLRVRDLTVSVPRETEWDHPVRGISFDVREGEVVGIVGESGSGKSLTMMSIAALIDRPLEASATSVRLDGQELATRGRLDPDAINRAHGTHLADRLAMVFQDPMSSLNPALRVGPQVAEVGLLHEGLGRREAAERALDRLRDVRIDDPERRAHQFPHEFSGGMRQRAMIAMGLMGHPRLLVADEPTTALDVTVQKGVLRLLADINRDHGTAIVLISHDIAVVSAMCTRVLVMYRGSIVESIATDELVAGRARHPYTRALLEAVPSMSGDRSGRLATIPEGSDFTATGDPAQEVVR